VAPSGRTSGSHFSGLAAPPLRNNHLFNLPNNEDEINKMIEEIREKEKKENEDKV